DLSKCVVGQGRYVPLCNHDGTLINDPVLLKRADDCFWLSVADSDMLIFTRAIAGERGLDVQITEPDVSPLAVQGPKAEDTVAGLFGDWVRDLKYFWFEDATLEGVPVVVQRSGWSKQGGFEIYLRDGTRGTELWNVIAEAGERYGIGPGNPNPCERVESGLLSWGGDTDDDTNPFEVRLGRYVDVEREYAEEIVGLQALRRINEEGPKRYQIGVVLDGDTPEPSNAVWLPIEHNGARVGHMTNGVWSRRLKRNIGFALVSRDVTVGSRVDVVKDGQRVGAETVWLPFI
ncbi:MAG: glycine cleavage T C-terminal barrel domain-containing protein, partial [Pseudomonadota bacterium]